MKRRVVVTGMGVISPIGNNVSDFWESLANGKSGIGTVTKIDISDIAAKIAGEVKDFDPLLYFEKKEVRRIDLFAQYAFAAAQEAIEQSGLDMEKIDRDRAGVIVGSGIGGLKTLEDNHTSLSAKGPRRISPYFIQMMISDISPGLISIRWGLKGPNYATTSACATASHAIGASMKAIQYNDADVMIAGGSEAAVTRLGLGGFSSMKALSTRNDEPERASRPFEKDRDGFVLAEGGGVLVLEELGHAIERGAQIFGEIISAGFTGDAFHVTAPPPGGEGAVRSMRIALKDAGMTPEDIDYINAHGTSTEFNDKNETMAIKTVFGESAENTAISSTKSMTGHLLGASGSVELIACILAMQNSLVPPTINFETPDPECDLNYTPNTAVKKEINTILSNSFGFGGHNASLIAKKYVK